MGRAERRLHGSRPAESVCRWPWQFQPPQQDVKACRAGQSRHQGRSGGSVHSLPEYPPRVRQARARLTGTECPSIHPPHCLQCAPRRSWAPSANGKVTAPNTPLHVWLRRIAWPHRYRPPPDLPRHHRRPARRCSHAAMFQCSRTPMAVTPTAHRPLPRPAWPAKNS